MIMKKITILAIAAVAISFASCKKDRVCSCTTTTAGGSTSVSSTSEVTYTKATKADATHRCASGKQDNGNGTTTTYDCKLK